MSSFKNMPLNQRPREKALQKGIETLSDSELLAIILKTGSKNYSVMELSTSLLVKNHGLMNLLTSDFNKLCSFDGVNKVKALEILTIYEICKRLISYKDFQNKKIIKNNYEVYERYKLELENINQEKLICLYLNLKNELIKEETLFIGGETFANIEPKIIIKKALNYNSSRIYLIHNHPSGDSNPSVADIEVTKNIFLCAKIFNIEIIEHLIIGKDNYYAILEKKLYSTLKLT